jgi:ATP-dependent protease ClpP protease subunit
LIVPDPNFRPNPSRAIYVLGLIDQGLLDRLTPRIVAICSESREPITVYIDSHGGSVASGESILRLLQSTDQDGSPACHLITVVTGRAASAAADLLSSGDYAIAYPESNILYHGVRTSLNDPVTVELASFITESLKLSNDRYAMTLAKKSEVRFMFRFFALRPEFPAYRTKVGDANLTDLQCFLGLVGEKISHKASKIVGQAWQRYERYNALLDHVFKIGTKGKKSVFSGGRTAAQMESVMLRAIIQFELKNNKDDSTWTFRDRGLVRVNDDFFLLQEYFASAFSDQFRQLCERWGKFVLSEADIAELGQLPENERNERKLAKLRPHFQPAWSFLVALCHALQEGENELAALDAFWLGLIDEVLGQPNLPLTRYFAEYQPDPEPAALPAPTAEGVPAEGAPGPAPEENNKRRKCTAAGAA